MGVSKQGATSDLRPLRVGLLGLGTVAQGVLDIMSSERALLDRRAGRPIVLAAVASRRLRAEVDLGNLPFSTDLMALTGAAGIDVIVECIGGEQPALDLVRSALAAGKSVVTANKALIAMHGDELHALARERGVQLAYEAAVAGGIPILTALTVGLAANRTRWLAGIINGTGNFILTAMAEKGQDFGTALTEAQTLGYAEADPSFDIEGIDAAHKLTILAALAFDTGFHFADVYTEGITDVTAEDIEYAERLGYRIKHLGIARRRDDLPEGPALELRVHPALVPAEQLLAQTSGVTNAVVLSGHAVGVTAFVGPGAGGLPTASAVVADLVALARDDLPERPIRASADGTRERPLPVLAIDQTRSAFFLRIPCEDRPGVFAKVATTLSEFDISIEAVIQREQAIKIDAGRPWVPVALVTRQVQESRLREAVAVIRQLPEVVADIRTIRIEHQGTN